MTGQRFGQIAAKWKSGGHLAGELHEDGSGTNKGSVCVCMGREHGYFGENNQFFEKGFEPGVVTPEEGVQLEREQQCAV